MKYPLVRELAADGFPVTVTCRILKFSPQGYYQRLARPVTSRGLENACLTNPAIDAHHDDPVFGYRFIADELIDAGFVTSECRVRRWTETPESSSVRNHRNAQSRLVITHHEYCVESSDRLIFLIQSCPFHTDEGTFV